MAEGHSFIVASAQLAPVFMDRKATVAKACEAIAEAARNGAKAVVFPEVFVPQKTVALRRFKILASLVTAAIGLTLVGLLIRMFR